MGLSKKVPTDPGCSPPPGELLPAQRAADMGLINHCVPHDELDRRVEAFAGQLLGGAMRAICWTKMAVNAPLRAPVLP